MLNRAKQEAVHEPGWALGRTTEVPFSDNTTTYGIPGCGKDEQAENRPVTRVSTSLLPAATLNSQGVAK